MENLDLENAFKKGGRTTRKRKGSIMMASMMVAVLSFAIAPSTANAYANIPIAQIVQIGTIISTTSTQTPCFLKKHDKIGQ